MIYDIGRVILEQDICIVTEIMKTIGCCDTIFRPSSHIELQNLMEMRNEPIGYISKLRNFGSEYIKRLQHADIALLT